MPEDRNSIQQRLSDYSIKTNTNTVNIALLNQRMDVLERRTEEYHKRLHEVEDAILTIKVVQGIHDTQIHAMRKILVGNGERDTIPFDLDRLENSIQGILKVDWVGMGNRLKTLEDKDSNTSALRTHVINVSITALVLWLLKLMGIG
jgi:hypothetical protein